MHKTEPLAPVSYNDLQLMAAHVRARCGFEGISALDLSRACGISYTRTLAVFNGKSWPTLGEARQIATLFGMSLAEFASKASESELS